jgi:epoxyqueuosine reductase
MQQNIRVNLKESIRAEAFRLGFSLIGFSSPKPLDQFDRYENWLSNGFNAGMIYLNSNRHRTMRKQPDLLVPDVKTIISLGWSYSLQQSEVLSSQKEAWIAGYTAGKDYHQFLPMKMDQLTSFMQKIIGQDIHTQSFTDSAPILEREIGSRAGFGWIGKNSCLISPKIGSAFLLAELFVNYPLQADQPFTIDRCGTCHRCIDACPTGCIQSDRTIDSNRCISYLTIENKNNIPEQLRPSITQWLFGCDICQTVCPWNRKSQSTPIPPESPVWTIEDIYSVLFFKSEEFLSHFEESSLLRSKLRGLQRNALVWIGNNGSHENAAIIEKFKRFTTDFDLLECADWAIKKII